jgi:hypothetical protein
MLDDIFFMVFLFRVLSIARIQKKFSRNVLLVAHLVVIVYQCPTRTRWQWILAMATSCCKTSMAAPLGVLPVGLAASTIEVEEDVDGGAPRRHCRWVQQSPPRSFEDDVDGRPYGMCYRWVRQRPPLSFVDDRSRSHPVSKHPTNQSVESSNYPFGARTLGCRSSLRMRVRAHIAVLG